MEDSTAEVLSEAPIIIIANSKSIVEISTDISNDEPPRKIVKLSVKNLDPLKYFSRFLDIPEITLQHLNGEEMIKISEVSSTYYNFIASSKVLMKKIKIVFNDIRTLHQEDYDLLKNSSRMYESVELRGNLGLGGSREAQTTSFPCKTEFRFFFEKTREWKKIGIVNTLFENELDLWELLSAIQSTVKRLTLNDVRFKKSLGESFAPGNTNLVFARPSLISTNYFWEFPKLKKLKLICFKNREIGTILSRAVAVEKLELIKVCKQISMKLLKNFDHLTSLKLYAFDMIQLFETDVSNEFQFKLKSFTLSFKDAERRGTFKFETTPNENVCSNFLKFLLSQSDHLEELFDVTEFDSSCLSGTEKSLECFKLIMRMPKLKRLGLRYFPDLSENEENFHVPNEISSSITELRFDQIFCDASFKFLLNSMPRVKRIPILSINTKLFDTLNAMERKFDELIVTNLEVTLSEANHFLINENWKDIQFKLKRLSIGSATEASIWMLSESVRQNLKIFLKSQSDYLRKLSISCDKEIFNLIMKMRNLKKLSLMHFNVFYKNFVQIEISTSITTLTLKTFVNSDGLKYLLESMPNVKRLMIKSIDQEIFQTLAATKRKFEELHVHKMTEINEESLKGISDKIIFY